VSALVIGLGVLATTAACGEDPRPTPPPDYSCSPGDFERATVAPAGDEGSPGHWKLTVSGMETQGSTYLLPVTYVRQPAYWEINVQVCGDPDAGYPTAFFPYTRTIDLTGVIGSKGVQVVGANKSEQLAVPPLSTPAASR
jgi:hypothetical protein